MAVKDLVGIYESKATPSRSRAAQDSRTSPRDASSPTIPTTITTQHAPDLPSSSPARFVAHPLLRRREPSTADQEDDPVVPNLVGPTHDSVASPSSTACGNFDHDEHQVVTDRDVTDELLAVSGRQHSIFSRGSSRPHGSGFAKTTTDGEEDAELKALLPSSVTSGSKTLRNKASADSLHFPGSLRKAIEPSSSTFTLVSPSRSLGPHTSIPLSTVIARDAAPMSLPKLDEYISTLEMPKFPAVDTSAQGKGKGNASEVHMFPPLDRLKDQSTLSDLENNATIAPAWRDRTTIFSAITNIALGITVRTSKHSRILFSPDYDMLHHVQGSSAIASFYSVQGLVDTLQIFALLLSTFCKSLLPPPCSCL